MLEKDKESLPEIVSRGFEVVEEYTGKNVKKITASTVTGAYIEVVKATAIALPLVLGGTPGVAQQQEPVKRPGEHISSQTQQNAYLVAGELEALGNGSPPPDLFWSGNDDAPFWSGDDSALFWS